MLTLATGIYKKASRSRGFTLIEILVVMVIIGALTSIVTLSYSSNNYSSQLKTEALRLRTIINLAIDEATLQATEIGIIIEPDRYNFLEYKQDIDNWIIYKNKVFKEHHLSDDFIFSVSTQGQNVAIGNSSITNMPDIYFLSSGEISPFEITISLKNDSSINIIVACDGVNNAIIKEDN